MKIYRSITEKSSGSLLRSSQGQYLVELAAVLPLLLLLTFAVIDFSTLFYVYLSLENGISQATRYGITGQQLPNPDPVVGGTLSKIDSIKLAMKLATPTLSFTSSNPQYTFEHLVAGTWTTYNTAEDAKGNEVMRVTVRYHWDMMTPFIRPFFTGGGINLIVSSSVKNEGFS
jgi:Flp pilus assembly protein TadG